MKFLSLLLSLLLSLFCLIFGHSYLPATCEEPSKCSLCSATVGEALGHNYENGYCSHCGVEAEKKMTPEDISLFTNFLKESVNCQKDALNCMSSYIDTYDDFYITSFYNFISLAEGHVYGAYNMSLKYDNMESVSSELKASYDILSKMEDGNYTALQLIDMIDDSITHIGNAANEFADVV